MITSKSELKEYLSEDKKALGYTKKRPSLLPGIDEIWKFQILYRKYEYIRNIKRKKALYFPYMCYLKMKFQNKSIKLGFSIPINVFDKGLSIAHYGTIVVNGNAKIGKYCRIQENVTIGSTNGSENAPKIGDYVFIGSGAKLIGEIMVGDYIAVGAGSVVTKSFQECGITIAGVPAKKISKKNSFSNLNTAIIK